ncbi:MAG: hypothetical protein AABW73_04250 [Nanoarchaeota archaeon]
MVRVVFDKGKQKEFFDLIKEKIKLLSLRSINQYGIETNYSTIKNYYNEKRLMPESLLKELCYLAKINIEELKVKYANDNWGQIKGGKKGIITLRKNYANKVAFWRRKGGKAKAKKHESKLSTIFI